jgi:hypothetical protein
VPTDRANADAVGEALDADERQDRAEERQEAEAGESNAWKKGRETAANVGEYCE